MSAMPAPIIISLKQRQWQKPLIAHFRAWRERGGTRASVVAHRRAGKDRAALFIELEEMLAHPCEVWHCLPEYGQARKVIWEARTQDGKRLINEAFPPGIVDKRNDHEMTITLKNGALWRLVGADNFNTLVGSSPRHVTMSEYALMMPNAWSFIRPILAENNGTALFITTYRGYNHAYDQHESAKTSERWYAGTHPVSQTKLISDEVLAEEAAEMPSELYRQEYECDPSAANVGAILGSRIEAAEQDGRVSATPLYDPAMPVIVSSDIGFRDAAAFWFWQPKPDGYALIDYDEESGLDADEWADRLNAKGYRYEKVWLPHDAMARTFATRRSAMERFKAKGLPVYIVPNTTIDHRINAARLLASRCRYDKTACAVGLKRLRGWAFKWDDARRVFSRDPLHDENSHGGDAYSYGALVLREADAWTTHAPVLPKQDAATFKLDQLWEDRDNEVATSEWR